MASQTQRPALSSSSISQEENASDIFSSTDSKPIPHETIWFEDGSIVLATDVHLYRIHKSVLSKNSVVFRDMFDLPTIGERGETGGAVLIAEEWEGLPLVKMVGDSDEDVFHLLMAMYEREYHQINKPTTLPKILSLLALSTKYDVPAIRREVIQHLEIYYPTRPKKWSKQYDTPLFDEMHDTPKDFKFQLLAAALLFDVKRILPMLFYECAIEPWDAIFESSSLLDAENYRRIVMGRERLASAVYKFGKIVLRPHEQCQSDVCSRTRMELFVRWLDFNEYTQHIHPLDACADGLHGLGQAEDLAKLRQSCVNKTPHSLSYFECIVWDALPDVFRLDEWEILEEEVA
ncbi:hypothetical protein SCHPADRAFT_945014 [Schizopora paradoxa]|uniref:BTB domain-containing protein n=1 Tax=Schizopora paradoxa TaxID=27342 RepID=A0A0H2R8M7_9AGAM|nr:hypothetical protein SCHPADRAFT_945014 [Schizopora paradoxa]